MKERFLIVSLQHDGWLQFVSNYTCGLRAACGVARGNAENCVLSCFLSFPQNGLIAVIKLGVQEEPSVAQLLWIDGLSFLWWHLKLQEGRGAKSFNERRFGETLGRGVRVGVGAGVGGFGHVLARQESPSVLP